MKISKNLNEDQIIELLSYAEYEIFFKTINCTKYDEFSQLVSLLPQTMVQELVHLKKGLLFRSIIVNGTADDYTGKLDLDDFRQKLAFFMKIDGKFFRKAYVQMTSSFKSPLINEEFNLSFKKLELENVQKTKGSFE